ncbi:MAG TPA: lipid-binding SYLF domain-containing protein [Pyrinomonadaceae bacterium]|nr:lipid-binding SYLF domain-containing protein [Pyrinomonadaceae bacterium]
MKLSTRKTIAACALAAAALFLPAAAAARQTNQPQTQQPQPTPPTEQRQRTATKPETTASPKQLKDASKKAASAARVFEQVMGTPERSIPKTLLDKAEAVAVFPGMLKAGLGVGGRGGSGLISRRVTGGWSAPAFFKMGGASIGLQIGAAKTDLVLLFMNEDALKGLLGDKLEIGGEASAAAGPVGRTASASTNIRLDAGILSYSRSKGLFAGLELKGDVINPDNNLNEALYGLKAKEILTGANKVKMADVPAGIIVFPNTLGRYSKK